MNVLNILFLLVLILILVVLFRRTERYTFNYKNQELFNTLLLARYPVNSIYITTSDISPSEWIPNTEWELVEGNCAIQAVNKGDEPSTETSLVNTSFGTYSTDETQLQLSNIPNHTHIISDRSPASGHTHEAAINDVVQGDYSTSMLIKGTTINSESDTLHTTTVEAPHTHEINSGSSGAGLGHSHEIKLPFVKFFVWKRTA